MSIEAVTHIIRYWLLRKYTSKGDIVRSWVIRFANSFIIVQSLVKKDKEKEKEKVSLMFASHECGDCI